MWCLHEVKCCHAPGTLDHILSRHFRTLILELRTAIGKLESIADFPIPFFFVHFLCLVSAVCLPLFAAWTAFEARSGTDARWPAEAVACLVVVSQAMYVNGLHILGQKMIDTYGDDLTDLSVLFYVQFTWTVSNRMHESQILNPDVAEETAIEELANLHRSRMGKGTIGIAFSFRIRC